MTFERYRSRRFALGLQMNGLKHLLALAFLSMAIATPALAQNVVRDSVGVASSFPRADRGFESAQHVPRAAASKVMVWLAPVGHRQPHAADIPKSASGSIDPEEAIVDQAIGGIFRGC